MATITEFFVTDEEKADVLDTIKRLHAETGDNYHTCMRRIVTAGVAALAPATQQEDADHGQETHPAA